MNALFLLDTLICFGVGWGFSSMVDGHPGAKFVRIGVACILAGVLLLTFAQPEINWVRITYMGAAFLGGLVPFVTDRLTGKSAKPDHDCGCGKDKHDREHGPGNDHSHDHDHDEKK